MNHTIFCGAVSFIYTCSSCLNLSNTIWCNNECLYSNNSRTINTCEGYCGSSVISSLKNNHCSASSPSANLYSVVISFTLLVICPFCVIGACLYAIILRCYALNKIGPLDGDLNNGGDVPPMAVATATARSSHGSSGLGQLGLGQGQSSVLVVPVTILPPSTFPDDPYYQQLEDGRGRGGGGGGETVSSLPMVAVTAVPLGGGGGGGVGTSSSGHYHVAAAMTGSSSSSLSPGRGGSSRGYEESAVPLASDVQLVSMPFYR